MRNIIRELEQKAIKLKTKKAKEKVWDKIRELESAYLNELYIQAEQYRGLEASGTVLWCDGDSLCIDTIEYGKFFTDPSNAFESKSLYSNTCCVTFEKGDKVSFKIGVGRITVRGGIELVAFEIKGGKFDAKQYAKLCKNPNLAFFRYPTGMTGLFK
jgi:hypothetical protein